MGDNTSIARASVAVPEVNEIIHQLTGKEITSEIVGLRSKNDPSLLRKPAVEQLADFSWDNVNQELRNRAPWFVQFLEAATANPSQSRNSLKTKEALIAPMLDAGFQLVSIFNEDMNAIRKIKSIVLKEGGLKKSAFKRLSPLYVCMGYGATNTLFETAGKGFDKLLLKAWKSDVEEGVKKENSILLRLANATKCGDNFSLVAQLTKELSDHRGTMRPGYSFTGDNVDMRILPRQMTLSNKNKDHHMYQLVAFKNRIPSNDLSNENAKNDVKQVPLSTFLPSAAEQSALVEEFVILVGHVWGQYIPLLSWFLEHLPQWIVHAQMDNQK